MTSEVIRTERIEIVDSEGRIRATLGMQKRASFLLEGPVLAMYAPDGKRLVSLELLDWDNGDSGPVFSGHGPSLVMHSQNGAIKIDLGMDNGAGGISISNLEAGYSIDCGREGAAQSHEHKRVREFESEYFREEAEMVKRR